MCRRFVAVAMNVFGSSNRAALEVTGRDDLREGSVPMTAIGGLTQLMMGVTDMEESERFYAGSGVKWFRCADPDGNVLTFAQSR